MIHVMFYNEVYVVALGPSVYRFITPAKSPGNVLCPIRTNAYISELPPLLNHMPPDINWKRRKYNLDCREVGRGTQSAACVPIVHVPMV